MTRAKGRGMAALIPTTTETGPLERKARKVLAGLEEKREMVPLEDLLVTVLRARGPLSTADLTRIMFGDGDAADDRMRRMLGRMKAAKSPKIKALGAYPAMRMWAAT